MATTEEVTILLKTVGDTSGAQQVSQSLQQTQQIASQTQQQLSAGQQGANVLLRAVMAQHQQTLESFHKAVQTISQSTGVAPTLLPKDFGIQAQQATTAARTTATAVEEVGRSAQLTGGEVLRMGAAFLGAGVGLSAFTAAGSLAHEAIGSIIQDTIGLDQATRANTIALGQQAPGFQAWAQQVSQAAGVTQQSLLEAGTAGELFRRQIGAGPETTRGFAAVAEALARIHGTDPGQTISQLTAAMQGNAGAANALGLQLDAATLSYQNFGDATGEVFNMLDPSSQAALRYQAALGQVGAQAQAAGGPVQDLQRAQGELNTQWEAFSKTYGTGVTEMLAGIIGKAGEALESVNKLNALTLARNTQAGGDEGFKNELALFQAAREQIAKQMAPVGEALGQRASEVGSLVKAGNDALKDTTGFDAHATAANAANAALQQVQQAGGQVGQTFDALGTSAANAARTITAPFRAADQEMREAAAAAGDARETQLKALAAQIAEPAAALAAARQNEATASQELLRLRQEQVSLAADEAQIRLGMLPATERMLELTNATTQAQIRAQQSTLGTSRAQQDLQNQIRLNTLIAQSPDRSLAERQQALASATALTRRTPEADIAALQAQIAATPAQRAAQDVGLAAQLQGLQQQQALFPAEYQRQQDALLSIVADAAKQAAQRTERELTFDINVTINQTGAITPEDERRIATFASDQIIAGIHSAVQSVNNRGAAPQLMASTSPS